MKLSKIIKTAQSNLKQSKTRTFLTVIAVFIAAFTLAMTTAVSEGGREYVNQQVSAYGAPGDLHIEKKSGEKGTRPVMTQADFNTIKNTRNITNVYPEYSADLSAVEANGKNLGPIPLAPYYGNFSLKLAAGTLPDVNDKTALIIPYAALSALGYSKPADAVGKTVHISYMQGSTTKSTDLIIKGVTVNTVHVSGAVVSYLTLKDISYFTNGNKDVFSSIYATYDPHLLTSDVDALKKDLNAKGYFVATFRDNIVRLNQVINLAQLGMSGFAAIALLVATIGIVNTMLMSVLERKREIGLLKALGMRRKEIFLLFSIEAVSIGFWGGFIGILIAIGLGPIINKLLNHYIQNLEGFGLLKYPVTYMTAIVLFTMLVGFLAGIIPAMRASKLDPIEALRQE